MPRNPRAPAQPSADLADRVELQLDQSAPKGNALPPLVRLLRKLVEHDEQQAAAAQPPPRAD